MTAGTLLGALGKAASVLEELEQDGKAQRTVGPVLVGIHRCSSRSCTEFCACKYLRQWTPIGVSDDEPWLLSTPREP